MVLEVTAKQAGAVPGFLGFFRLQKEAAGLDAAKSEDELIRPESGFGAGECSGLHAEYLRTFAYEGDGVGMEPEIDLWRIFEQVAMKTSEIGFRTPPGKKWFKIGEGG